MRLLFVTPRLPHLPCHDAARVAVSHVIDQLARRHIIAVVTAATGGDTPGQHAWLNERAEWVETVSAGRWRRLSGRPGRSLHVLADAVRRAAEEFAPDVVHVEGSLLAPVASVAHAPVVLACHESAAARARHLRRAGRSVWLRLGARLDERIERAWERRWCARAAACVVDSEDERRALAERVRFERIDVIPAGIDAAQHGYRRSGEPWRLVFTGDLDTPRDVEAARRLATTILPLVRADAPRAELLVAGGQAAPDETRALAALPGVRVASSLVDLRPSVWSGAVYVSPLNSGSGRKIRLLEPMALGTPVVASRASLAGLPDVLPGHHALAADRDDEFAEAVLMLLRDPVVANTIARNARDLVERRFTWRTAAQRYEALYARLVAPRGLQVAA
jgi:glycosyltransferase involved in cell wall biosynthesis